MQFEITGRFRVFLKINALQGFNDTWFLDQFVLKGVVSVPFYRPF